MKKINREIKVKAILFTTLICVLLSLVITPNSQAAEPMSQSMACYRQGIRLFSAEEERDRLAFLCHQTDPFATLKCYRKKAVLFTSQRQRDRLAYLCSQGGSAMVRDFSVLIHPNGGKDKDSQQLQALKQKVQDLEEKLRNSGLDGRRGKRRR